MTSIMGKVMALSRSLYPILYFDISFSSQFLRSITYFIMFGELSRALTNSSLRSLVT